MPDYAQARKNMLDCQLATNGIIMQEVLDAFSNVPRERFLPENRRGIAYLDEDLRLDGGAFCMEPMIHARMVQAADPRQTDAVLNIGDVTGYSSAILSGLVSTVVTLESQPGCLDSARVLWDELNYCNIAVVSGQSRNGCPGHAPYDLIFINGAVTEVPDTLLDQLADKGRLVTVIKKPGAGMGRITKMEKIANGKFSSCNLYDAATPYIPDFAPDVKFVF